MKICISIYTGMECIYNFTSDDLELAKEIARKRDQANINANNSNGKLDPNKSSYDVNLLGTISELAASKLLDLNWEGKFFEFKDWLSIKEEINDIEGLEIRATEYKNGKLIIKGKDNDNDKFILAIVNYKNKTVRLAGWIFAKDAKKMNYLNYDKYGRKTWWIPQFKLNEIQ